MNNTTIGIKIWVLLIGTIFLQGCRPAYETVTDMYYITNATECNIFLRINNPAIWDTCPTENPQRVWFDSTTLQIDAGKTIRLHPITREVRYSQARDEINVAPLLGTTTILCADTDTIIWHVKNLYMFTSDSVWSIYNTRDWQTEKDNNRLYTFHHTFAITSEKIERSLQ